MKEVLATWVDQNPEVSEWLSSVGDHTAKLYAFRFNAFFEFLTKSEEFKGYTVGMLLDFQDNATGRDRVKLANRLGVFLKELGRKYRPKTVTHYYSASRSFFNYHGCELPSRGFTLPEGHKEPAPQLLTREDLVKIIGAAKLRDKAIYTIAFMGAMGWKEFNQFNHGWDQIGPQLEAGQNHILFKLKARKKKRGLTNGFYTIVGRDGIALMREYLEERGTPRPGEPIFLTREGGSLAARTYRKNFENLCRRVDLIKAKKGKDGTSRFGRSPHQFRDVARTEFQRSGADPVTIEFMMGHSIDSNKYLQFSKIPDYVIEQYKLAEPRLSLISKPDLEVVAINEVERLRKENEDLQKQIENAQTTQDQKITDLQEQLRLIQEYIKKRGGS